MSNPVVTLKIKDKGVVKIELFAEDAPQSVDNFISLIETEYYDGLIFHRIIKNFMIQGGCPDGTGMGGPGHNIYGEFKANGFDNKIKHTKGTLSMARSQSPNSAGSQFFICHVDTPHLDGSYAAFGRVTEGQDVVDAVAKVQVDGRDRPLDDVVIESMTVELNGHVPGEVKHY
ncbi:MULTISPECIES: peptidylprolyl isomerase [unclassified Fusibacter]|uniref:peptidylprolyl isomerase n=1 Tax=unclassified Fusibacter TaxID=2624464 RepID=UPI001011437A|nr:MULTISPECIES: peptidylprolyl isomerase [unclassified Fusibacter]MCK8061644.1 peptidylprolyl isomerase [Fusibacter sp. A2]NPE23828.1 peptidylprolyl isomerase [Fusibacter sp. A1]RXV58601.1 peptidylprolyl isomerase [Fusibacter sp. A1]